MDTRTVVIVAAIIVVIGVALWYFAGGQETAPTATAPAPAPAPTEPATPPK